MILNFQRTNPKLYILPPLSITGVECPLHFSYIYENGFQFAPRTRFTSFCFHHTVAPLLRSVPCLSAAPANSQCSASLRKGRTVRGLLRSTTLRFAPLGGLRCSKHSASLRCFSPSARLPPPKVLASLCSARVHFPPSLPRLRASPSAFPPLGLAGRSALLRSTFT